MDYSTLPSMGEGMFYVLKPNANPNSTIFVPAFNEKLVGMVAVIRVEVSEYTAKHRPLPEKMR